MQILFWSVDCQKDFMLPSGKLYVKGAEEIVPNLNTLTKLAKECKIKVVSTGDYHTLESKELSDKPDFVNTFPEHCIIGDAIFLCNLKAVSKRKIFNRIFDNYL